ncbi:hypothetical protein [Cupriavidus malaysiensis]|nr:hypothetical protein [Cupriavidus malaysiensis]
MSKFFDKKLEEELGTAAALQIAAIGAKLRSQMDAIDAVRIAKGRPTLQEEMEEAEADIRQMIANGEVTKDDYPWLFDDYDPCGSGIDRLD